MFFNINCVNYMKLRITFFLLIALLTSPKFLIAQVVNVNSFDRFSASNAFSLAMKSNHDTLFFDSKNSPYILNFPYKITNDVPLKTTSLAAGSG